MPETYSRTFDDDEKYGDHQLRSLKGGRYGRVIKGPPGTDVGDLHIDVTPVGGEGGRILVVTNSGWEPTHEQLVQLEAGAHVMLSLWQYPPPPVAVTVEPPVCSCHGEAMQWDPDDEGFYCARLSTLGEGPAIPNPEAQDLVDDAGILDDAAHRQARADFKPQPPED